MPQSSLTMVTRRAVSRQRSISLEGIAEAVVLTPEGAVAAVAAAVAMAGKARSRTRLRSRRRNISDTSKDLCEARSLAAGRQDACARHAPPS